MLAIVFRDTSLPKQGIYIKVSCQGVNQRKAGTFLKSVKKRFRFAWTLPRSLIYFGKIYFFQLLDLKVGGIAKSAGEAFVKTIKLPLYDHMVNYQVNGTDDGTDKLR